MAVWRSLQTCSSRMLVLLGKKNKKKMMMMTTTTTTLLLLLLSSLKLLLVGAVCEVGRLDQQRCLKLKSDERAACWTAPNCAQCCHSLLLTLRLLRLIQR